MVDETNPDASQAAPWFTQSASASGGAGTGLSTTPDDSNTNIVLNKIATDLGSQSGDVVTALDAITTALNAKPAA